MTVRAYERARLARDARFDGRFFTAVLTTGIYCRPVCPAHPPKARNVRYYPTAAAAEEAGFRPCLRCRPETAPGSHAWLGTSTTVARALRLIEAGALDEAGVEELAERLGVTSRHLSRLFRQHLGASPVGVAQTRRLKAAKQLVDQTALPLTQIALASGYGSLRRFNAAFQERYGRAPRELRREGKRADDSRPGRAPGGRGVYRFELSYRPPYDWQRLFEFLTARAVPALEQVTARSYARTIALDGQAGWLEVRPLPGRNQLGLRVEFGKPTSLYRIIERVRRMFDLDADPLEIASCLQRDRRLGSSLRKSPGLRLPGCWDGFELAVRAVLGQQVTVAGARRLAGRLVAQYGDPMEAGFAGLQRLFPSPQRLAQARFHGVGLTGARARTVKQLAQMVADRELCLDATADPEETVAQLNSIPGIGDWTAQYVAMRALGDPDAFPASDLGVRKALGARRKVSVKEAEARAEAWRPWRAYAVMHLWQGHVTG